MAAAATRVAQASRRALVAVGQMTSGPDREANLGVARELVQRAAARGVQLMCLPENFHFMGNGSSESLAIAEELSGPWMARYCKLAAEFKLWLSLGGFQEKSKEAGKLHNTHVLINPAGAIATTYRKVHLFDVDIPGNKLTESSFTGGGESMVAADVGFAKLGLSTCYDMRFPALYDGLRKAGAQVMLVPAAFTVPTGHAHWEVLLRARAIETQSYVIAAAQVGKHNAKRSTYGHSMIVDPWGAVVAQCSNTSPDLAVAEVDLDYLDKTVAQAPTEAADGAGGGAGAAAK